MNELLMLTGILSYGESVGNESPRTNGRVRLVPHSYAPKSEGIDPSLFFVVEN